ncbi:hypothetical protein [Pseudomonas chlororaphis]|uniref:hypothetical protein n=1 Tax=Pseudomonas chlororaphis TaxID=587753 RepID=UPI00164C4233
MVVLKRRAHLRHIAHTMAWQAGAQDACDETSTEGMDGAGNASAVFIHSISAWDVRPKKRLGCRGNAVDVRRIRHKRKKDPKVLFAIAVEFD